MALVMSLIQKRALVRLKQVLKLAAQFPTLRKLGPKSAWSAEIQIVGEKAMISLNSEYRGKKKPTDVLSFPAGSPFRETGLLGELIICLPVLKKQARDLGHSAEQELTVLTVHGVLHLLGLDHEKSKAESAKMARWEAKILNQILGPHKAGLILRTHSGMTEK